MSVFFLLLLVSLSQNAKAQEEPEPSVGEQFESLVKEMSDYFLWLFGFASEEVGTDANVHDTQEITDHMLRDIDVMINDEKLVENEMQKAEKAKEVEDEEIENEEQEKSTEQVKKESTTKAALKGLETWDTIGIPPGYIDIERMPETPFGRQYEYVPVIPIEQ